MAILEFPNPRQSTPDGIVAIGGDLEPDSLKLAYRMGIFPWPLSGPRDDFTLAWFCPPERAILEFSQLHISRSLKKFIQKNIFQITLNQAFRAVIESCAESPRPGQDGTWITPEMIDAYCSFHNLGFAHSIEVWKDQILVGGLYGVEVDGIFSAESMFHRVPNASKIALIHLVELLRSKGFTWIDIQVMTPHLQKWGAHLISRDEFLNRLKTPLQFL
jgi:leucyl/phenylalanyl-tRNA--protein transferase